ncbi:hypothetical protein CMT60_00710 [Elizabethkingia anophelis]|uniref:hypothetical protein n=1 Tax=Elizabethkingia anophelis TaxID=1117645 RepID=UPI000D03D897|nr:hypothetical protein [Elizabethkingia anophelis]PRQ81642.1 hypothetical protein CMT60_00710 [Elizabethkingia anophelis]
MKPKLVTAILLFISAYSPLFLILAVKDFDFNKTHYFKHPIVIYTMLGIALLSVILLFVTVAYMDRGNMPVMIKSVKNRSVDLINYTIPYIVSFFSFDLSKTEDMISLSIFLLLMLLLTIKSKSVFMNPILLLAGYNLYDLEYEFDGKTCSTIVISKEEMYTGERFYIKSLTRFLYIVIEKKINNNTNETEV